MFHSFSMILVSNGSPFSIPSKISAIDVAINYGLNMGNSTAVIKIICVISHILTIPQHLTSMMLLGYPQMHVMKDHLISPIFITACEVSIQSGLYHMRKGLNWKSIHLYKGAKKQL